MAWVLLATMPGASSAQQRGLQPADYYDLVTVGDVAVSPEGDLVAFTVTRTLEEENRRRREIWMQELENGGPAGDPYSFSAPTGDSYGSEVVAGWIASFVHLAARGRRQHHMVRPCLGPRWRGLPHRGGPGGPGLVGGWRVDRLPRPRRGDGV